MHNEDEDTVTFDLIVDDQLSPTQEEVQTEIPVYELKGSDLVAIYLMIKAVRRGHFGEGDERVEKLTDFVGQNAAIALVYEADNPK